MYCLFDQIFCLKPLKINLNTVLYTLILDIYSSELIKSVYNKLIKWDIVRYLNVKLLRKNFFQLVTF